MRLLRLATVSALLCWRLPAPLIPGPNLAGRIQQAGEIVVARVTSGTILASGSQVSSDITLHVERVLKGDLAPGSDIAAHLEGRGYFMVPGSKQTAVTQSLYGIWLLRSAPGPHIVIPRAEGYGELYFAPVMLPEGATAGKSGETPAGSVANEMAAALRWLADTHGSELHPRAQRDGMTEQRRAAGVSMSQFHSLADDFQSLDRSTTLPVYRRFAADRSAPLRALGIAGLIGAGDPEGVKLAAAGWDELSAAADIQPLIAALMGYANGGDAEAVRALGTLALRDPAEPGLRENAAYALRAIHTKDALPALVALLDRKEDRIRPYALSGLCLFIRNAPAVTPQTVPSMAWMQIRPPTPLLNPETERYCLLGGNLPATELDAYVAFWKSWWSEHRAQIEGR